MTKWKWVVLGVLIVVVIPVAAVFIKENFGPQMHSINLQYISGAEAASVLREKLSDKASILVEGWSEHTVFVRGSDSDYRTAMDVLAKEDRPAPEVTLRFQIIEADGFTQHDDAIKPVESVLRGLFRYQGYRLAAEAYLRARENTEATQSVAGADDVQYSISAMIGDVVRRGGKASAEVHASLRTASGGEVLGTTVNMPDGQTVVLGTARPSAKRAAIILVVTPEIK